MKNFFIKNRTSCARFITLREDNEAGTFLLDRIYTWARFVVFRLFRFSLVDRGAVRRCYYPG